VNFDEGWNPGLNPYNHMEGMQVYTKSDNKSGNNNESTDTESVGLNSEEPWGMALYDGSYEDGMPEEVYEYIRGTYSDESRTFEVLSPYEARLTIEGENGIILSTPVLGVFFITFRENCILQYNGIVYCNILRFRGRMYSYKMMA